VSADNGYILRKNEDNKFVLQTYWASAEDYPPIDAPAALKFDLLEDAVTAYEDLETSDTIPSEYGLTVLIKKVTKA
jgi:hypothetical protein